LNSVKNISKRLSFQQYVAQQSI